MDPNTKWMIVISRYRRQLPLDIEHCSPISLRQIILDVRTSAQILDRIAQVYSDDEVVLRDLVCCPNLSETTLAFIALTASEDIKKYISSKRVVEVVTADAESAGLKTAAAGQAKPEGEGEQKKLNVQQIVQRMTTPQKIKLALAGGKDARGLLIRESNKQISLSVLDNPRITDGEIESFSQSQNLNEDIMRRIGTHPDWSRRYNIMHSLIFNPKCPVGISLNFVVRMNDRDLAILERSRSVPEAVRTASRNMIIKRKLGKK